MTIYILVADHSWIIFSFLLYVHVCIRILCSMYVAGLISVAMSVMIQVYAMMKETFKYLAGIGGPSGYGSSTTAEQVVAEEFSSCSHPHLTAIITGTLSLV